MANTFQPNELDAYRKEYDMVMDTDPRYSLEPDPTGRYGFNQLQKEFIKTYVDTKSLAVVEQQLGLDPDSASRMFYSYNMQQEIRRITKAQYMSQFNTRMMNVDEIGGYLTALITDDVPLGDRLDADQKMKAVNVLVKLNEMKQNCVENGIMVDVSGVENEIQNLNADELKRLIAATADTGTKKDLQKELVQSLSDSKKYSNEELSYFSTLTYDELKLILNDKEDIENEKRKTADHQNTSEASNATDSSGG